MELFQQKSEKLLCVLLMATSHFLESRKRLNSSIDIFRDKGISVLLVIVGSEAQAELFGRGGRIKNFIFLRE